MIINILDLELEMFLLVNTGGPNICQEKPDAFRLHRGAQFTVWSEDTLQSYITDLETAKADGVNLMTVKYARMDHLISKSNDSMLVDDIVAMGVEWQREMIEAYPNFMSRARNLSVDTDSIGTTSFESYLRSECETYSENTLALLKKDYEKLRSKGENGSLKVYEALVRKSGFDSLDHAETVLGASG